MKESERIKKVLDTECSQFSEHGIVKTILRERIEQEKEREKMGKLYKRLKKCLYAL